MEKRLFKYLRFHFLLVLIVGIYLQFYFSLWNFGFKYLLLVVGFFLILLIVLHKFTKKFLFGFITLLLFVLLGISSVYIKDNRSFDTYYKNFIRDNSSMVLTIDKVLKPGNYYTKYVAEVSQVNQQKTRGVILLNIKKDSLTKVLNIDDKIVLKSKLKNLIPPLNPHQFSYKDYLAKQGIYNQVFVDSQQYKVIAKRSFSLVGLSSKFRNTIQKALKKYNFKQDEYGVISALLLGQRQEISKELLQDYSKAGAIHILAVSGLHVGIILLLLNQFFKQLTTTRKGTIVKTILIIFLLWVFAFIAGLSASVVRAVTMFTFVAIGQSFKRKRIVEHSLIASMFLLLIVKPMFLFDVGFQLSYLAVFGIVWFQPLLYNLWKPKLSFIDKGWQLFTVSLSAQVGILPISLFYFHQFPSLFLISNLVIIPFLGGILLGGILIIILALLGILPQFLANFYGKIISLMNSFVSWISHQEEFLLKNISMEFLPMLLWYFLILSFLQFFIKKTPKTFILGLFSVVFIQFLSFYRDFKTSKKQEFIVFHKSRKSVLGERKGKYFTVFSDVDSIKLEQEKLIASYKIGENIIPSYKSITPNIFRYKKETILRIDSLGIYKVGNIKNPIILLQYSPKINLKRLVLKLKPKLIIADGTNYKSYINRWEVTSKKEKTPFFYTGKNGAYILKE